MIELTAFEPEVDFVKDYEIAPGITSIEWLNRYSLHSTMSFVVANDKKIRLLKLRKDFCDEFRAGSSDSSSAFMNSNNYGNQYGGFNNYQNSPMSRHHCTTSFAQRCNETGGHIVFPKTRAYTEWMHARGMAEGTPQMQAFAEASAMTPMSGDAASSGRVYIN